MRANYFDGVLNPPSDRSRPGPVVDSDPVVNPPSDRWAPGPTDPGTGGVLHPPTDRWAPGPTDDGSAWSTSVWEPTPRTGGGKAGLLASGSVAAPVPTAGGYTPSYTPTGWAGWDTSKWADPTHQTVKYAAGRWMAQHPGANSTNIAALLQYLQSLGYTTAPYAGGDTIRLLGGNELAGPTGNIDVSRGMTAGGGTGEWQWGDWEGPSGASVPTGTTSTAPTSAQLAQAYINAQGAGGGATTGTSSTPAFTYGGASTAPTSAGGGGVEASSLVDQSDPIASVTNLYQYYYGRTPTPEELQLHTTELSRQGANYYTALQGNLAADAQRLGLTPGASMAGNPNQGVFDDPIGSAIEQLVNQRVAQLQQPITDPARDEYARLLQEQIGYLSGDVFSPSENAAMRAASFDQLERDHQSARQRVLEQMASRGIDPSSGVAISALQQVDQQYEQLKAQRENGLLTYGIDANTARRTNRLGTAESWVNLNTQGRNEYNANQQTALALLGALEDLSSNRFNQSLALSGQASATSSSLGSTLMGILQNLQNQGYLNSQQSAALWNALGSNVTNLINKWPTSSGTKTNALADEFAPWGDNN